MSQVVEPSKILKESYDVLFHFKRQLEDSLVTQPDISHVIDFIHKESTIFNRHVQKLENLSTRISAADSIVKNDLVHLIDSIMHSPSCNIALGSMQVEFANQLKKFEQVLKKWVSKVEKAEFDQI